MPAWEEEHPPGYIFAYGSLLSPDSLRRTLPGVSLETCVPARCAGHVRNFGVAFPNDGSQQDKAYYDKGSRPPVVLFCDMPLEPDRWLNGVCVPVDDASIDALKRRELRYELHDVATRTTTYEGVAVERVSAFVGAERYTRVADIGRGVLQYRYLETVQSGARYWDAVCQGFYDDFVESTVLPERSRVRALKRVDAAHRLVMKIGRRR